MTHRLTVIMPAIVVSLVLLTGQYRYVAAQAGTVTVSPASGPAGSTVVTSGSGWRARHFMSVSLDTPENRVLCDGPIGFCRDIGPSLGSTRVDGDGRFSITATIPPGTSLGEHYLAFAELAPENPILVAYKQVPFLVTTAQPTPNITADQAGAPEAAAIAALVIRLQRGVPLTLTSESSPCPSRTGDCLGVRDVFEGDNAAYVRFGYGMCDFEDINPGCQAGALIAYVYRDTDGWHFLNAGITQAQGILPVVGDSVRVKISGRCANVRSRPGIEAPVVDCLTAGTIVPIDDGPTYADGDIWWYIRDRGWMAHEFLINPFVS